jgi:ABC-2 type transport system ATP-binding protein
VLQVRGVHKSFGETKALAGVDVDLRPGQVKGLLGPNGAGKTTLVSIIAGLLSADAGTVDVAGVDVARHPEQAHRHIGLAPQELGIYPTTTVRQNLALFGRLADLRGADLKRRIDEVAEELGLDHLLERLGRQLSGGEKRRLHTACALLHRPAVLLLDEPTAGADVTTRAGLIRTVRALAENGSAILYSTHYLEEVERLCAEVMILDHGTVVAQGSCEQLVAEHRRGSVEPSLEAVFVSLTGHHQVAGDGTGRRL